MEPLTKTEISLLMDAARKATPGPWGVKWFQSQHRLGSPACRSVCVGDSKPDFIEHSTLEEAEKMGYPGVTEMHVYSHDDMVDGVVAGGEQRVIDLADDSPYLSPNDARYIAAANPSVIKRLCAMVLVELDRGGMMTFTTWIIAMVYLLSGAGVLLALNDDDRPLGFGGILIAVVCVAIWPMFFMFALTTYFRSMAEQRTH